MEDWLPKEIGAKEKNYLLDNITSVMTKLEYISMWCHKEAVRLERVAKEVRNIKTGGV